MCASVCKHASVRGVFRNKTSMVIIKTILGTLENYMLESGGKKVISL